MNSKIFSASAFQRGKAFTVIEGGASRDHSVGEILSVSINSSNWVVELKDRFERITSLESGWDGYQGRPVSFACAEFAANLLETIAVPSVPAPSIVPGSDGTLQFEWHVLGIDLEVDVLGPNNVVASRYVHENGIEEQEQLTSDFSVLAEWIDDMQLAALGEDSGEAYA